ncbi:MAG: DinB family protein [Planctomycetaceae bacterium]
MNRERIETYAAGGQQLLNAYAGLSRQQLLAIPEPGTWSLHQIAIHLMDSDLIGSDRMKRVASMELPLLCGYDESAFSRLPGTNELDTAEGLRMFVTNRQMTAVILRHLPDDAFQRCGIHDEAGKLTLADLVEKYIQHLNGHLAHVFRKRAMLGVPLRGGASGGSAGPAA